MNADGFWEEWYNSCTTEGTHPSSSATKAVTVVGGGGCFHRKNMKKLFAYSYQDIISLPNLLDAWKDFVRGKRGRKDVQEFAFDFMGNIIALHNDLTQKIYRHSPYEAFNIADPKQRNIHKASVRDRELHRALYRMLYPFFDRTFIADSYSCRQGKGTHKALEQFRSFAYRASEGHTKTVWVLQCDIRKFFASIDQSILSRMLEEYIPDRDILWLISEILRSFHTTKEGIGLPLGNLTSQLFVNIYMNTFDQFMKHRCKAHYYIRYADDFVILSSDKQWLQGLLPMMQEFLWSHLRLVMHPDKIFLRTVASGVDFLGWVHFLDHRVLRTITKKRMMRRIAENQGNNSVLQSYLGLLQHGNTEILQQTVESMSVALPSLF